MRGLKLEHESGIKAVGRGGNKRVQGACSHYKSKKQIILFYTSRSRELRPIRRRCCRTKNKLGVRPLSRSPQVNTALKNCEKFELVDDLEGLSHTLEYADEPRWGYCVEIKTSSIDYFDRTQAVMSGAA
jgi:hypothetical protein